MLVGGGCSVLCSCSPSHVLVVRRMVSGDCDSVVVTMKNKMKKFGLRETCGMEVGYVDAHG